MKKSFVIAMLALQLVGAVSVASAVAPIPECLPCRVDLAPQFLAAVVVDTAVAPIPECLPCKDRG